MCGQTLAGDPGLGMPKSGDSPRAARTASPLGRLLLTALIIGGLFLAHGIQCWCLAGSGAHATMPGLGLFTHSAHASQTAAASTTADSSADASVMAVVTEQVTRFFEPSSPLDVSSQLLMACMVLVTLGFVLLIAAVATSNRPARQYVSTPAAARIVDHTGRAPARSHPRALSLLCVFRN